MSDAQSNANETLTRLRALAYGTPSVEAWHGLCALLEALDDGVRDSLGFEYMTHVADRWPDAVRPAPSAWFATDASPWQLRARALAAYVEGTQEHGERTMAGEQDITGLIERIDRLEARCGVGFRSLAAFLNKSEYDDSTYVQVTGELVPKQGDELAQDLKIVLVSYDDQDRIVGTSDEYFDADTFFMFDVFSFHSEVLGGKVSKLRIFPKLG